jgi:hypothetical protein
MSRTEQWERCVKSGLILWLTASGLGLGVAQAGVVWSNGAVESTSPRFCDSSPLECGGNVNTDNGFEIYDNFTLASDTIVSGFTYNDGFRSTPTTDYTSTEWTLWSSDPATAGGPIDSGDAVAVLSSGDLGSTLFTVTGLDVDLSAGTYWLGTQNELSDPGDITDRFYADGDGLPGFEQSTTGISTRFGSIQPTAESGDTAFTIQGSTPEPATGLLIVVPMALVGLWRIRRTARTQ